MKVDFDISGWSPTQSYKKFDVVFFSGHSVTGCNPFESGYYYATADNSSASNTSLSPTGTNTKWTRSFPSTPSYNSSVSFSAENNKHTFGDGYYTLLPKFISLFFQFVNESSLLSNNALILCTLVNT